MANGQVKMQGTSSELKSKSGFGFKISIILKNISDHKKISDIQDYVMKFIPEADLIDMSGGALLFTVPSNMNDEIINFLTNYEENKDSLQDIEDLVVSNSTLEEVFMKITAEEKDDTMVFESPSSKELSCIA